MNRVDEFDRQWKTLLDTLETRARRTALRGGRLDAERCDQIVRDEVKKWRSATHYNGAWLERLSRADPEAARAFRAALAEVRVARTEPVGIGPVLVPLLVVAGAMAAAALFLRWRDAGTARQLLAAAGAAVVVAPIVGAWWSARARKATDTALAALRAQLAPPGQRLRDIVASAGREPLPGRTPQAVE